MKFKPVITLVSLFTIAVACTPVKKNYIQPEGPKYWGNFAREIPQFQGFVKIVSYNIKMGEKVKEASQELNQIPELKDADILLLQEMDTKGVENVAQSLGLNFVYYPAVRHSKNNKDFGNAILSKWAITDHKKVILPHQHPVRKMKRVAVFATVDIEGHKILVSSIHTETYILGYEKKLEQVEAIIENIYSDHRYVVVGGDFNTEVQYSVMATERLFHKAGFKRATKGVGKTAKGDPLGIIDFEMDHIFVRGMEVIDSGKYEEASASDHLPVWALLKIDEGTPKKTPFSSICLSF